MKLKFLFLAFIFILGVIYLTAPSPALPELSRAVRSNEPGDTWQHPDQKGFYSNMTRSEVLGEMQSKFFVKVAGLILPSYRLNYPVEEAGTLVRDQLKSNYLEETVYPMRESLFVNGWEPRKSPEYSYLPPAAISDLSIYGVVYEAKITLRPVYSPVWARLLVWILLFPTTWLVFLSIKKTITSDV